MFVGWCKATSLSLNGEQQLLGDNDKDIFLEVQLYWEVKSFNFALCSDWVEVFRHIAGVAQGKATSVSRSTTKTLWLFHWHPDEDLMGNVATIEWYVAQIFVSPSGSLHSVFCAMMRYEIWGCIFLIIQHSVLYWIFMMVSCVLGRLVTSILSHRAFQKGSCTKVNNPHWEYYDQNQLSPFMRLCVTLQIAPWDGP